MMKSFLVLVVLGALTLVRCAAEETNGFLVFTVERYAYKMGGGHDNTDLKQSFKVPLTVEFLANFKYLPSTNRAGTGFLCSGGNYLDDSSGSTGFSWWLDRTEDRHWRVHMWSSGVEKVGGVPLQSRNPSVSQGLAVKNLEDLDMYYQLSFVGHDDGLNVEFRAKYMSAQDVKALGNIPTAPVQKADRTMLFPGEIPTNCPVRFNCMFQEN